jgi:spore germination protein GerM
VRRWLPAAVLAAAVPLLAACGAGTGIRDEGALASPQSRNALVPSQPVGVYFPRYGALVQVTRRIRAGDSFAQAALVALMTGPNADEFGRGFVTALPTDARVVNVTSDPDTGDVRVDLAGSFDGDAQLAADPAGFRVRRRQMQLEQIVYTLAGFPTIRAVSVYYNGVRAGLPDISGGPLDTDPLTTASFQTLAGPADSSDSCETGQRLPPRPALRLGVQPSTGFVTGRFLRISGSTTAKTGTLIVELVQDTQQIRPTQLFNKRNVPCQTFTGRLEIPFGVSGSATVRAFVQEREQAKPKSQVDVPVTIVPSS